MLSLHLNPWLVRSTCPGVSLFSVTDSGDLVNNSDAGDCLIVLQLRRRSCILILLDNSLTTSIRFRRSGCFCRGASIFRASRGKGDTFPSDTSRPFSRLIRSRSACASSRWSACACRCGNSCPKLISSSRGSCSSMFQFGRCGASSKQRSHRLFTSDSDTSLSGLESGLEVKVLFLSSGNNDNESLAVDCAEPDENVRNKLELFWFKKSDPSRSSSIELLNDLSLRLCNSGPSSTTTISSLSTCIDDISDRPD